MFSAKIWRDWVTAKKVIGKRDLGLRCVLDGYSVSHGPLWWFLDIGWVERILEWRHNEGDGVSNHQPHECLLKPLFRRISKKTSKLPVTGLCPGNSPVTGEFPAQRASYAENVPIWWRHHGVALSCHLYCFLVVWEFFMPLKFRLNYRGTFQGQTAHCHGYHMTCHMFHTEKWRGVRTNQENLVTSLSLSRY